MAGVEHGRMVWDRVVEFGRVEPITITAIASWAETLLDFPRHSTV